MKEVDIKNLKGILSEAPQEVLDNPTDPTIERYVAIYLLRVKGYSIHQIMENLEVSYNTVTTAVGKVREARRIYHVLKSIDVDIETIR